jgi:hypothetical protein
MGAQFSQLTKDDDKIKLISEHFLELIPNIVQCGIYLLSAFPNGDQKHITSLDIPFQTLMDNYLFKDGEIEIADHYSYHDFVRFPKRNKNQYKFEMTRQNFLLIDDILYSVLKSQYYDLHKKNPDSFYEYLIFKIDVPKIYEFYENFKCLEQYVELALTKQFETIDIPNIKVCKFRHGPNLYVILLRNPNLNEMLFKDIGIRRLIGEQFQE